MSTTEDNGDLGAEVTSRLDELFAEEDDEMDAADTQVDAAPEGQQAREPGEVPPREEEPIAVAFSAEPEQDFARSVGDDPSINKLKALVTEIDWEITDEVMRGFLNEVDLLKEKYRHDPILLMYMRLHESIGKYIKARKARAHSEAIRFITSVFNSFEKVVNAPDMPTGQKKKLLSVEMQAFKSLKQKLSGRKPAERKVSPTPDGRAPEAPVKLENKEAIDHLAEYIVQKIKLSIREEFEKIRREMEKYRP